MTNDTIEKDALWHSNSFETAIEGIEGLAELLATLGYQKDGCDLPDDTLGKIGTLLDISLRQLRDHHNGIWEEYRALKHPKADNGKPLVDWEKRCHDVRIVNQEARAYLDWVAAAINRSDMHEDIKQAMLFVHGQLGHFIHSSAIANNGNKTKMAEYAAVTEQITDELKNWEEKHSTKDTPAITVDRESHFHKDAMTTLRELADTNGKMIDDKDLLVVADILAKQSSDYPLDDAA